MSDGTRTGTLAGPCSLIKGNWNRISLLSGQGFPLPDTVLPLISMDESLEQGLFSLASDPPFHKGEEGFEVLEDESTLLSHR